MLGQYVSEGSRESSVLTDFLSALLSGMKEGCGNPCTVVDLSLSLAVVPGSASFTVVLCS